MACALVCMATSAGAQVPGEEIARRAFEDGVALEKKGDYGAALAKFRESALIKSTLGNRFHTAYCLEMTGKLAGALTEYEAVDKLAREQRKNDVVEATRARVEPLRPRVPQLSIHVAPSSPKDLDVILDDSAVSPILLDGRAFRVDPGEHEVVGRAPGHRTFTKRLGVAEGTEGSVDVVVEPIAKSVPRPERAAAASREPTRGPTLPTIAVLAAGGAGLLATGGIVAFVLAGSAQSDAEQRCPTKVSCDSEQSKVRTLDALALAGFVSAAGLAAFAIVVWASRPTASSGTTSRLIARPSWIGLEGRF
jgi:hypothetical protein